MSLRTSIDAVEKRKNPITAQQEPNFSCPASLLTILSYLSSYMLGKTLETVTFFLSPVNLIQVVLCA